MILTVRDLPEEVLAALSAKAERQGKSREAYLRQLFIEMVEGNSSNEESFYLVDSEVQQQLEQRVDQIDSPSPTHRAILLGQAIAKDLNRYYSALESALASVELTQGEASLLCDVCNGTRFDLRGFSQDFIPSLLMGEVEDGIKLDGLDRKWEIDGAALLRKLKKLSPLQAIAVIDAIERFWTNDYQIPDIAERLKQVGLIHDGEP